MVIKKVRLPKGETDVEGFAKVVDSFYRICTQKNLLTGKTPTPEDFADIKFPLSVKSALIAKGELEGELGNSCCNRGLLF